MVGTKGWVWGRGWSSHVPEHRPGEPRRPSRQSITECGFAPEAKDSRERFRQEVADLGCFSPCVCVCTYSRSMCACGHQRVVC